MLSLYIIFMQTHFSDKAHLQAISASFTTGLLLLINGLSPDTKPRVVDLVNNEALSNQQK